MKINGLYIECMEDNKGYYCRIYDNYNDYLDGVEPVDEHCITNDELKQSTLESEIKKYLI